MTEHDDNVVPIAVGESLRTIKYISTEYAEAMEPEISDTTLRLGVAPEFNEIFSHHLRDIHVITLEIGWMSGSKSGLSVEYIPDTSHEASQPKRVMVLHPDEIQKRQSDLMRVFDTVLNEADQGTIKIRDIRALAFDWLFSEYACVALGNACFMQQNFGTYIPDFNGQALYYQTQNTISAHFIKEAIESKVPNTHPDYFGPVSTDALNLREGFGIMMLHQSLLTRGVVHTAETANHVIEQIRLLYPEALRSEGIIDRLQSIKPVTERTRAKRMAQYLLEMENDSSLYGLDDTAGDSGPATDA
ncbi:MAG: hypothetical protein JWS12_79 [Candidatus Saccharibacteria bacterium]|nr:hypothetical protein [Candidatus Saccharibacteria bacterium]